LTPHHLVNEVFPDVRPEDVLAEFHLGYLVLIDIEYG